MVRLRGTDLFQIEAANPGKIAPAVRKGGKRASGKPSLLVTLPLPAPTVPQAPLLPSAPSASAPKIKVEDDSEAQSGPSSLVSKKRSAALIADNDDSELFTPTSSKGPAPKKQRVQPATRKPRAAPRAKVAVKSEVDERPEPRGQPEVWAEVLTTDRTCEQNTNTSPGAPSVVRGFALFQCMGVLVVPLGGPRIWLTRGQ